MALPWPYVRTPDTGHVQLPWANACAMYVRTYVYFAVNARHWLSIYVCRYISRRARDAAIIVVYLRMHVYSQTTYPTRCSYLRDEVIEVVGFKFKVRRIALHMTVLEGAWSYTTRKNEQAEVTKGESDDKDIARLIDVSKHNVPNVFSSRMPSTGSLPLDPNLMK